MKILNSTLNRYGGRWVELDAVFDEPTFSVLLAHSVDAWQREGVKVIWLPIPATQSNLIHVAVAQGFAFHHAKNGVLTLTKRLVEHAIIPDFANHTLGAGAIVFNDENQILMIVEKHDVAERPGHWKFPGGMVDSGELIRDAVVRETLEETGVTAEFQRFIGMRHYHQGQFNTSNIYVICRLRAINTAIQICPEEIGKAKWFDVDTYLAMESVSDFNKEFVRAAVANKGMCNIDLGELHGTPVDEYEIFG